MDLITPLGSDLETHFQDLIKGKSGVDKITQFDSSDFKTDLAGEVKDFDPDQHLTKAEQEKLGTSSQYAIVATKKALERSQLLDSDIDKSRIGVAMGTTMGEIPTLTKVNEIWMEKGASAVPGSLFLQYPSGVIAANVGHHFNLGGPNIVIPTACAAGNYAIGYAYDQIQLGKATAMIAGGSDSLSKLAFSGFNRLHSLAADNCRPFDKNRSGIVISEGCGVLVLEDYDHAMERGATIHAEVFGYGLSCSAFHMITPHPEGMGAMRAMNNALRSSGIDRDKIDYISAHGTGTQANDKGETLGIKKVFGDRASDIPISSIKSMLGHTMGAASAIEAVTCAMIIEKQVIPPTINYEEKDPHCDLDYVPNQARERQVNYILSNAYAFGGNDSSVLIGKLNSEGS